MSRDEASAEAAAALAIDPAPAPVAGESTGTVRVPAEVVALRGKDDTGRHTPSEPPPAPPLLASEILREDLEPTEPLHRLGRAAGLVIGALGAASTLTVGELVPGVVATATALSLVALLSIIPLSYTLRSTFVLTASLTGLIVASVWRVSAGDALSAPLLTTAIVVLSAGLVFRWAYRASRPARWLTAAGIGLSTIWLLLSGAIAHVTAFDQEWQSWAMAVTHITFVLLLLLSLLAFMNSATTGASQVWGGAVLVWYALCESLVLAVRAWPPSGPRAEPDALAELFSPVTGKVPDGEIVAMALGATLLAPIAALAIAQLLAVAAGGTRAQRNGDGESAEG